MADTYETFAALHVPGNPVVLYNIWDVEAPLPSIAGGCKGTGTGSHPVADANGWPDGQRCRSEFVFANARRIVDAVEVPLTVDFEGAYSADPEPKAAQRRSARGNRRGGLQFRGPSHRQAKAFIRSTSRQGASPRSAKRSAMHSTSTRRTDLFLKTQTRDEALIDQVVERARPSPTQAPSGFFVPRLPIRHRSSASFAKCLCRSTSSLSPERPTKRSGPEQASRGSVTAPSRIAH